MFQSFHKIPLFLRCSARIPLDEFSTKVCSHPFIPKLL